MNKLKGQKIVSCRICKGDHWTTRCPYKDTLGPMQKELAEQLGLSTGEKEKLPGGARAWDAVAGHGGAGGGLCAPPGETLVFTCCDGLSMSGSCHLSRWHQHCKAVAVACWCERVRLAWLVP